MSVLGASALAFLAAGMAPPIAAATVPPTTTPASSVAPKTLAPTTLAPTTLAPTTLPATSPPATSPPTTLPATTVPPTTVPLQHVLVVGDSVVEGVVTNGKLASLEALLPGWQVTFDAKVSRSTFVGSQVAKATDPSRYQVVIVVLGHNDGTGTFPTSMAAMMTALAPVPRVYWLTLHEGPNYGWFPGINAELRQAAPSYPNLVVADWNAFAAAHPADFYGDGLHLQAQGGADMATFLATLVVGTNTYVPPPTTTTTVPPTTLAPPPPLHVTAGAGAPPLAAGESPVDRHGSRGLPLWAQVLLAIVAAVALAGAYVAAAGAERRRQRRIRRRRGAHVRRRGAPAAASPAEPPAI